MLRNCAQRNRSDFYVCVLCRRNLPTTIAQLTQPSFSNRSIGYSRGAPAHSAQCTNALGHSRRRWFSSQPVLYKPDDKSKPAPSFPGALGGMGFGAFGAVGKGIRKAPEFSDGLLPHERHAQQVSAEKTRVAEQEAKAKAKATTKATWDDEAPAPRKQFRGSQRHDDAMQRSRSALRDVFQTDKQPTKPTTPRAWSQQDDGPSTHAKPQQHTQRHHGGSSSVSAGNRRVGSKVRSSWSGEEEKADFGMPRNRRSRTMDEAIKARESSSKVSTFEQMAKEARRDDQASGSKSADETASGFWAELESRVAAQSSDKPSKQPPKWQSEDPAPSKTAWTQAETKSTKERRVSRFEREERNRTPEKQKSSSKKGGRPNARSSDDAEDWDDLDVERWERKQQAKQEKQRRKAEEKRLSAEGLLEHQGPVPIFIPEYISVSSLAEALERGRETFVLELEEMGFENITTDTIMTGETAALISQEYGFEPTVDTGSARDLEPRPAPEDPSVLPSRPPVVTIMGHVDHGKTTLLDWLRKSSVAAQEHGGITQHIGAFIVEMSSGKPITFLDTPGHAAFLSMRQRGANATDIVVLVVAADDSVMPQTLEALKHATAAKVPIIVAITKVDKEAARVDQVKSDLARHGIEIEDYGGDVQVVCVSGRTGQGMDDLQESILTLSEILDVRAETEGMAEGYVLESTVKHDGRVATILVKRGTLRVGDNIVAGSSWAKIRVLRNEAGAEVNEAPPGTPVEVLGWRSLPTAGEQVIQAPDEGRARTAVEYRQEMAERQRSSTQLAEQEQRQRDEEAAAEAERAARDGKAEKNSRTGTGLQEQVDESGMITQNFTVKADVLGSVEAVCGSIQEQGNNEIQSKVLRAVTGPVSEYDVDHAAAANSIIVNFNTAIAPHIRHRAEEAKVRIMDHSVIYHVVDDVREALTDRLPPLVIKSVKGEADVLQIFSINTKKKIYRNIAGCRVRNGALKRGSHVRVVRNGKTIFDGQLDTLKHVKKDVMEMGKGSECGVGLDEFEDFRIDDQIQTYVEIKEKRTL